MIQLNSQVDQTNSPEEKFNNKFEHQAVVMFGDISGYSNLCNALRTTKVDASERIAFLINGQLDQLCKIVMKQGGDIFKFAGDAIIVLFILNESSQDLPKKADCESCLRRAIQCSLEIQDNLHLSKLTSDVTLSIKIGISMGPISIINIGGMYARYEYVPTGAPLLDTFDCEGACEKGDIFVSQIVQDHMNDQFHFTPHKDKDKKHMQRPTHIRKNGDQLPAINFNILKKANMSTQELNNIKSELEKFVPSAATPFVKFNLDKQANQLRKITVLFINIGIDLKEIQPLKLNEIFIDIQRLTQKFFGSINKFLMDDKGSTLIICFGLPKTAQLDDPERAVFCAIELYQYFASIGKAIYIGATIGCNYCGIVGTSGARREQSILGEAVNLAARLMVHAKELKKENMIPKNCIPIMVDFSLMVESCHKISFLSLADQMPKGYTSNVTPYTPICQEQLQESFNSLKLLKFHFEINSNPVILDRDDELKKLKHIYSDFMHPNNTQNQYLNIEGKLGSGKTTLIYNSLLTYKANKKVKIYTNQITPNLYLMSQKDAKVQQNCFNQLKYQVLGKKEIDPNNLHDEIFAKLIEDKDTYKILVLDDIQHIDKESADLLFHILTKTLKCLVIAIMQTQHGSCDNNQLRFLKVKIDYESSNKDNTISTIINHEIKVDTNLSLECIKQYTMDSCKNKELKTPDTTKFDMKNFLAEKIKTKIENKIDSQWWYKDEGEHSIKMDKNEYEDLESRLMKQLKELANESPSALKEFVDHLVRDSQLKLHENYFIFSKQLRESLFLEDQSQFIMPRIIQRSQLMRFDNLIKEISEQKKLQRIEDQEFDPHQIILIQTASVIGVTFTTNVLIKLMPVTLSVSELTAYIQDLCELNFFKEYEMGMEFAFESNLLRDTVYQSLLQDSRKKLHRRQAAIRTVELESPSIEVLNDPEALHMFNLQQKLDLKRHWVHSRQITWKEYLTDTTTNDDAGDEILNSVVTKDIMQKFHQRTDGNSILWKELMHKDSSSSYFGKTYSKAERLICLNEQSLFQCQFEESIVSSDEQLQTKRLGNIPLEAIDKMEFVSVNEYQELKLNAKWWQKKREQKKERTFKFGSNDMKLVKEFQSALQFLIFKMKQEIFSEKFGKIKFPFERDSAPGMQPLNLQSGPKVNKLDIGNKATIISKRISMGRQSVFNDALYKQSLPDSSYNDNKIITPELKVEFRDLFDFSLATLIGYLTNSAVTPFKAAQNALIKKLEPCELKVSLKNPKRSLVEQYHKIDELIRRNSKEEVNQNLEMGSIDDESPNGTKRKYSINSDDFLKPISTAKDPLANFQKQKNPKAKTNKKGRSSVFMPCLTKPDIKEKRKTEDISKTNTTMDFLALGENNNKRRISFRSINKNKKNRRISNLIKNLKSSGINDQVNESVNSSQTVKVSQKSSEYARMDKEILSKNNSVNNSNLSLDGKKQKRSSTMLLNPNISNESHNSRPISRKDKRNSVKKQQSKHNNSQSNSNSNSKYKNSKQTVQSEKYNNTTEIKNQTKIKNIVDFKEFDELKSIMLKYEEKVTEEKTKYDSLIIQIKKMEENNIVKSNQNHKEQINILDTKHQDLHDKLITSEKEKIENCKEDQIKYQLEVTNLKSTNLELKTKISSLESKIDSLINSISILSEENKANNEQIRQKEIKLVLTEVSTQTEQVSPETQNPDQFLNLNGDLVLTNNLKAELSSRIKNKAIRNKSVYRERIFKFSRTHIEDTIVKQSKEKVNLGAENEKNIANNNQSEQKYTNLPNITSNHNHNHTNNVLKEKMNNHRNEDDKSEKTSTQSEKKSRESNLYSNPNQKNVSLISKSVKKDNSNN